MAQICISITHQQELKAFIFICKVGGIMNMMGKMLGSENSREWHRV